MATGVVKVEGKSVSLDEEIINAGKDAIRAALSIDFPGVENADIEIVREQGRSSVVTVSKRAQPKGQGPPLPLLSDEQARVVEALADAPEYRNPAVVMAAEVVRAELMGDIGHFESLARRGEVERAVAESNREGSAVSDALLKLGRALPACSSTVPVGF